MDVYSALLLLAMATTVFALAGTIMGRVRSPTAPVVSIAPRSLAVLLCLACTSGESGGDAPPNQLLGDFRDDYGISYSISDSSWHQLPTTIFHVVHWDSAGQHLIARNGADNPGDAGKWTRIDWLLLQNMEPYTWAYCLTVYDGATRQAAEAAPAADRTIPRTGCNGFPFSRMQPAGEAEPG